MVKETINKTDLLDPASLSDRSDCEKEVIADAQNAGNGPSGRNADDTGGVLRQTVNPEAIKADESGAPGGDSELSGESQTSTKRPGSWLTKTSITAKDLSKGVEL